jgi:hypothetical protein
MDIVTYERFAWLIITGSGLDDWIYLHFFPVKINYNSSQSVTLWDSLYSLLDYECLLFCCDEWRTKNFFRINSAERFHVSSVYNFGRSEYRPPLRTFSCHSIIICVLSVATKRSNLLLSNGVPAVDCVTSRMCLPNRCLAMDYSGF